MNIVFGIAEIYAQKKVDCQKQPTPRLLLW